MTLTEQTSVRIRTSMFVLTLVVVFSHATHSGRTLHLARFFDGFWAVKGFFFFSGYFLCRRPLLVRGNYRYVVRSRIMRLLLPYLIWSGLAMICFLLPHDLWTKWMIHWSQVKGASPNLGNFSFFWLLHSTAYPLWYVRTLFILAILSPAIYLALKRFGFVPILVVLAFECLQRDLPVRVHSQHTQTLVWFMLGGVFAIKGISLDTRIPVPAALLAMWLLCVGTKTGWYLSDACGLVGVWGCYPYYGPFVEKLGKGMIPHSFFIYVFHEPFMDVLSRLLGRLTANVPGGDYLVFVSGPVLTITVAVVLATLLQRHMPRMYGLLAGGRGPGILHRQKDPGDDGCGKPYPMMPQPGAETPSSRSTVSVSGKPLTTRSVRVE